MCDRVPRRAAALGSITDALRVLLILTSVGALTGCEAFSAAVRRSWESRATKAMTEHRFKLSRDGWEAMRPHKRMVVSLCRTRVGKVVSYAGVAPLPKARGEDEKQLVDTALTACRQEQGSAGLQKGAGDEARPTTANEMRVYSCTWEGRPEGGGPTYTYAMHVFIAPPGHPYDYLVSTSNPKGDEQEASEVKRLLESFAVTP